MFPKTAAICTLILISFGLVLSESYESIVETCKEGTRQCRSGGFTDQEIMQFRKDRFDLFNQCMEENKQERLGSEHMGSNNDEVVMMCVEEPYGSWKDLIQDLDVNIILAIRCCYFEATGMVKKVDDHYEINIAHFSNRVTLQLMGDYLDAYLQGLKSCGENEKGCMISSFLECAVSKCVENYPVATPSP